MIFSRSINTDIPFYYRYVDDIILVSPQDQIDEIFDLFNSYHERMKFMIEHSDDKGISFLVRLMEELFLIIKNSRTQADF